MCTYICLLHNNDDKDVAQHSSHTPAYSLTMTCNLGLHCTSLTLDIHVMTNYLNADQYHMNIFQGQVKSYYSYAVAGSKCKSNISAQINPWHVFFYSFSCDIQSVSNCLLESPWYIVNMICIILGRLFGYSLLKIIWNKHCETNHTLNSITYPV